MNSKCSLSFYSFLLINWICSLLLLNASSLEEALQDFHPGLYQQYVKACLDPARDFIEGPSIPFKEMNETSQGVIVSLTSWPKRIKHAYLAIEHLMRQSYTPDKICLWLADSDFPTRELPYTLQVLSRRGLEIRFCENFGPATKLISAMRVFPHATIITVDDDVVYDQDLVRNLVLAHQNDPHAIFNNRLRTVAHENRILLQYMSWPLCKFTNNSADYYLATGVGGVLYPPHSLHSEVFNQQNYYNLCFHGDDIWFFVMAILQNTPIKYCHNKTYQDIKIPELCQHALFLENRKGRNDIMIHNAFLYYGIYEKLGLFPNPEVEKLKEVSIPS